MDKPSYISFKYSGDIMYEIKHIDSNNLNHRTKKTISTNGSYSIRMDGKMKNVKYYVNTNDLYEFKCRHPHIATCVESYLNKVKLLKRAETIKTILNQ